MIWLARAEPSIGKENIDWAKGRFHLCHNRMNIALGSDITNHIQRAKLPRKVAQRRFIEVAEHQTRAARRKFTGQSRANAACGAG